MFDNAERDTVTGQGGDDNYTDGGAADVIHLRSIDDNRGISGNQQLSFIDTGGFSGALGEVRDDHE